MQAELTPIANGPRGIQPRETVDIRRHRQLTALLFAVVLGIEMSVGLLVSVATGGVLLAATVTLAGVVLRGQWHFAREMERAGHDFASEQVQAAYRDEATALPNRNQLMDDLVREMARADRYHQDLTLAMVDIERLGELASLWGQDVADAAVVHVAETLKRVARTSDILARVDERRFALVLAQCDTDQAESFADRLRMAVVNRPIRSSERMKVPLYVDVVVSTLAYQTDRYRTPLEFLGVAGGEVVPANISDLRVLKGRPREDVRRLRLDLLDPVEEEGEAAKAARSPGVYKVRRAIQDPPLLPHPNPLLPLRQERGLRSVAMGGS